MVTDFIMYSIGTYINKNAINCIQSCLINIMCMRVYNKSLVIAVIVN